MARLFITAREQQFISDLTKEFIKDVVGQWIIYYPISTIKTQVHALYEEAVEKIFENPIKIEALVGQPEKEKSYTNFGIDGLTKLEVFIQSRDLLDKQIEITPGDYFIYDSQTFEIQDVNEMNNIFGQAEYSVSYKVTAASVRSGVIDLPTFKQLLMDGKTYIDSDAQKEFEQQRGFGEDLAGNPTGDFRQLRDRLDEEMAPISLGTGPRVITIDEDTEKASSFYNEE